MKLSALVCVVLALSGFLNSLQGLTLHDKQKDPPELGFDQLYQLKKSREQALKLLQSEKENDRLDAAWFLARVEIPADSKRLIAAYRAESSEFVRPYLVAAVGRFGLTEFCKEVIRKDFRPESYVAMRALTDLAIERGIANDFIAALDQHIDHLKPYQYKWMVREAGLLLQPGEEADTILAAVRKHENRDLKNPLSIKALKFLRNTFESL